MDEKQLILRTTASDAFQVETAFLRRGGISVLLRPKLFKQIDNRFTRLIFQTDVKEVDDGTVIAMVCLWDAHEDLNVYAHCITAGPGSNAQLRAIYSPLNQVKPQAGIEGDKAIAKFIAWKQAAWGKFLNEELELGTAIATSRWLVSFWNALDRMYGGGNLRE